MNIYKVTYKGAYLGGTAFVQAQDEKDAMVRVLYDERTVDFNNVEVELVDFEGRYGKVFYNDNGDYFE